MTHVHSFSRKAIAIAVAAGVAFSGTAVASFSPIAPSAQAQEVGDRSLANFVYYDENLPIRPGGEAYASINESNSMPWNTEYSHNAPAGWEVVFDTTSMYAGSAYISVPEGTPAGTTEVTFTATDPATEEQQTETVTVEVVEQGDNPYEWTVETNKGENVWYPDYSIDENTDADQFYFLEHEREEGANLYFSTSTSYPGLAEFAAANDYDKFGSKDDLRLNQQERPGKYKSTLIVTDSNFNEIERHDIVVYLSADQSRYHETGNHFSVNGSRHDKAFQPWKGDSPNGYPEGTVLSSDNLPPWLTINNEDHTIVADYPHPQDGIYNDTYSFDLTYSFPDGSTITEQVGHHVRATADYVGNTNLPYSELTPGGTYTFSDIDHLRDIPEGAQYEIQGAYGDPEWVNWFTIDPDSGALTVTVPEDAETSTPRTLDVVMTWPDSSNTHQEYINFSHISRDTVNQERITFWFRVMEEEVAVPGITYNGVATANPGEDITIGAPVYETGDALPAGTTYQWNDTNPDWLAIDENGVVTGTVPEDQEAGPVEYGFDVLVNGEIVDSLNGTITVNEVTPEEPEEPTVTAPSVTGDADTVLPTEDEQDTGFNIVDQNEDTTLVGTDDAGVNVPVNVDEDGNITVIPGENATGPITIEINDPSLDEPIVIEVPVDEEPVDEEPIDEEPVDEPYVEGEINTVLPTDEEQDTGLDLVDPSDETTIVGTDDAGVNVPVIVDSDGNINVIPGENVTGPITIEINDPSLDEPIVIEIPVEEPVDEEPVDEDPVDEEPVDEDPADEDPADEDPADEDPADEDPVDEDPVDDTRYDKDTTDYGPKVNTGGSLSFKSFLDIFKSWFTSFF